MIERLRILASILILAAGFGAGASAWSQFAQQKNAAQVRAGAAPDASIRIATALSRCVEKSDCSHTQATALAKGIAAVSPGSGAPFVLLAFSSYRSGEDEKAASAATEALKRDPRLFLMNAILADLAFSRGDLEARARYLSRWIRASNEGAPHSAMAALAETPQGVAILNRYLDSNAPWRDAVLKAIDPKRVPADSLLVLAKHAASLQSEIITQLVETRGPMAAFIAWSEFVNGAGTGMEWPYDKDFSGSDAPAPFNWELNGDFAEIARPRGLDVVYLGRGQIEIAKQLMIVAPGRYRLLVEMNGDEAARGGRFVWRMNCAGSDAEIAVLPIPALTKETNAFATELTVPASDCTGQWLRLNGEPGDLTIRAHAMVRRVAMTPIVANDPLVSTNARSDSSARGERQ